MGWKKKLIGGKNKVDESLTVNKDSKIIENPEKLTEMEIYMKLKKEKANVIPFKAHGSYVDNGVEHEAYVELNDGWEII